MRMRVLKKAVFILGVAISLTLPISVYAENVNVPQIEEDGEGDISVCSEDQIKYYYRVVDGVLQFRRWNVTRGYWIDATWLNA